LEWNHSKEFAQRIHVSFLQKTNYVSSDRFITVPNPKLNKSKKGKKSPEEIEKENEHKNKLRNYYILGMAGLLFFYLNTMKNPFKQ
jgi:hypothetical protein